MGAGRGGDAEDDGAEREGYGAQARQGTQRHRDSLSGIRNWSGTGARVPEPSATTQAGVEAHGGARPGLPTSQTRAAPSDVLACTAIAAGRIATASGRPGLSTTSTTQRRNHQTTPVSSRAQHVCDHHPRRQLVHPPRRRRGGVLRVACVPGRCPGGRQRREQGVQPQLAQRPAPAASPPAARTAAAPTPSTRSPARPPRPTTAATAAHRPRPCGPPPSATTPRPTRAPYDRRSSGAGRVRARGHYGGARRRCDWVSPSGTANVQAPASEVWHYVWRERAM